MVEGEDEPEDAVLTQMGGVDHKVASKGRANFYFQCLLRDQDFDGVSCYEGKLTIDQAKHLITLGIASANPGDAVRHTTAGRLVKAGFRVTRTPDIVESHVSVQSPQVWDDTKAKAFHECFDEYRTKGNS